MVQQQVKKAEEGLAEAVQGHNSLSAARNEIDKAQLEGRERYEVVDLFGVCG